MKTEMNKKPSNDVESSALVRCPQCAGRGTDCVVINSSNPRCLVERRVIAKHPKYDEECAVCNGTGKVTPDSAEKYEQAWPGHCRPNEKDQGLDAPKED